MWLARPAPVTARATPIRQAALVREDKAELVVRAAAVHTFAATPPVTAFAVRDGVVVAVAGRDGEADLLRAWRGSDTEVIDDPGRTVLPGFVDTHCHLALAARSVFGVPVSQARDLAELVGLLRQRAVRTPPGDWIVTSANWHEYQLTERRLPTARELDQATADHPVLVLRGGHNGVVNSAGLRLAGIDRDTPDAPGGYLDRDAAGNPTGWLQDAAMAPVMAVLPPTAPNVLADGMVKTSEIFAAHGIATVRDPAVAPGEWQVYQDIAAHGRLKVRSSAMIMSTPATIAGAGSITAYLDDLEARDIRPHAGPGLLGLWGLKFVLDGGAEVRRDEPALRQPARLLRRTALGTRRTHRGARRLRAPGLAGRHPRVRRPRRRRTARRHQHGHRPRRSAATGQLVIEHGGLLSADRIAQATALGVHITAQHPLVVGLAEPFCEAFGSERAGELFPLRELLDAGAWVSAGTDHPIGPVDPLAGVYGMTTRQTPFGILGAEHAITREEALRLYTVAGGRFLGQHSGAPLSVGAPADFVTYRTDPLTCPVEDLLALTPERTVVNGATAHEAG